MKIECNEGGVIAIGLLCATLAGLSGMVYTDHKNELILKADTCEKAALIEGGHGIEFAICRTGREK